MTFEKKHKHLDYIQAMVARTANISFLIKGWTVTLVSALLVLTAKNETIDAMPLTLLPIILLWPLDGFFLWMERMFRGLYEYVSQLSEDDIDYHMDPWPFNKKDKASFWESTFSPTLIWFYGGLLFLSIVAILVYWYVICDAY